MAEPSIQQAELEAAVVTLRYGLAVIGVLLSALLAVSIAFGKSIIDRIDKAISGLAKEQDRARERLHRVETMVSGHDAAIAAMRKRDER